MNSHKLDFINLINLILVGPTPKRDLRAEVKKIRCDVIFYRCDVIFYCFFWKLFFLERFLLSSVSFCSSIYVD